MAHFEPHWLRMHATDPATAASALWFYALVLVSWLTSAGARGFVRL
jgi:hypothetical protein